MHSHSALAFTVCAGKALCDAVMHKVSGDVYLEVQPERGMQNWHWQSQSALAHTICIDSKALCLAVMNKVSGEVYLEGHLERGIVPEESVWEHGGGTGQDACLLHLHKMNLELLRK